MVALGKANQELASALNTLSIAQEELVRSKKLAALGSLVAGIAHELNTPIGNSLMAVSTLVDHGRTLTANYARGGGIKRSELEEFIGNTNEAGTILLRNLNRAASLIDSFKQVAVDQTNSARRVFLLDDAVMEALLSLRPTLERNGVVVQQEIPTGIQLDSYPGPLGQVLVNLVNNAVVHAFEGRLAGKITIVARSQADEWIELSVADDGVGIPPENLERIFDPFFTTKLGAGGCGLGLNVTHNIVSGVLGGHIRVESESGSGAIFMLTLPKVAPHGN
jgi:signal transduction histidine kinase